MAAQHVSTLLRYHAERDSGRTAIVCGDTAIDRGDLDRLTNQAARHLQAIGVEPGSLVTIALPNSIEHLVTAFAAIKIGAIPMPVSHRLSESEFNDIVELAAPAVVVGSAVATTAPSLPAGWSEHLDLDDGPLPVPPMAESWKAMTSGGSTGRPKVIVTKSPPVLDPSARPVRMQVDGTQLVAGPLYHHGPFMFSMLGLFTGATIVLMERFDAAEALRLIELHQVDWTFLVPTMTHRIWRLPEEERERYDLSSLATVFSTGAPWPVWLKEAWIGWLGPERILESYGGTESQGGASIDGHEALRKPGSVGRPVAHAKLRILDDEGRDVATGVIGEIYFLPTAGQGATYRYIGAEPRAIDGWETLGDLGYLDEDGYLYLVDRRTDMIVTGGANVYPAEVEGVLELLPFVRSAAVLGLPDDDLGQRVHAVVDIADHEEPTHEALAAHGRAHLSPYKVPRSFEIVREPLRDDAGKLRRSRLRDERLTRQGGDA